MSFVVMKRLIALAPDSIVIDKAGYLLLFPGEPLELGRELEMNDHRVTIVGMSDASAPFLSYAVVHARYREAVNFVGRERTQFGLRAGATSARNQCEGDFPAN